MRIVIDSTTLSNRGFSFGVVSFQCINSNSFKAAWIFGCMLDWTREYWLHAYRMCLLIECRNLPGNCSKSFDFAFAVAPFPTGHCQDWHSESRASYGIKIKDQEAWNLARSYVVARAVLLAMIPFSACSDVLKVLKNLCTKLITKLIWYTGVARICEVQRKQVHCIWDEHEWLVGMPTSRNQVPGPHSHPKMPMDRACSQNS